MSLLSGIWGLFAGSPKTTGNKNKADGSIECYSDIGRKTRKQISFHFLNGTDIPALIKTAQTGIIGAGISIQSRTKNEDIDNSFEDLIKQHAKKKNFEATGRMSRDSSLEMLISEKFRKGGVLIQHIYKTKWKIPYKVKIIGIDMIDVTKFDKPNKVLNGLRKDEDGAVIGYWIYTDETKKTSVEISADDVSCYMDYWIDISQYTAVSRLSQILPELDDILDYQKKELEAATERSQSMAFWHTKLYDTITDAIAKLYETQKAQKTLTAENFAELTEIQRTIMKKISLDGLTPGGLKPIPADDTITQIENKTSSTYEPFNKNLSNKMTASQNRSRVITYKNMDNTNWATIEALASIDESENASEMRRIVEDFLDEYLERLFVIGVQLGFIKLSWAEYIKNPFKYHKWEILRQALLVRNETKIATANEKNLNNELTTKEEIYAKRGKDYKTEMLKEAQTDIELKQEIEKMYKKAKMAVPEKYSNQQQGVNNNA